MNRARIFFLLLLPLILASLGIAVNAHPGKTDGSGGHYDHDSDEYHYHHGYPEHSHYDVDGDGTVDCPYNFDDQTDHDTDNDINSADSEINIQGSTYNENDHNKKRITTGTVLKAMLVCLVPSVFVGLIVSYLLSYLVFMIWGDDKGCSITIALMIAFSVVAYVFLVVLKINS